MNKNFVNKLAFPNGCVTKGGFKGSPAVLEKGEKAEKGQLPGRAGKRQFSSDILDLLKPPSLELPFAAVQQLSPKNHLRLFFALRIVLFLRLFFKTLQNNSLEQE